MKPFQVDKLKLHLTKLTDDVPQTLSPVLRSQQSVKGLLKNRSRRDSEGLSIVSPSKGEGERESEGARYLLLTCFQEPANYLGDVKELSTIKVCQIGVEGAYGSF